jgi:transposase-like protein
MSQEFKKYEDEMQDGRRKLTKEQKQEIIKLYATGNWSHRTLGKKYEVDKGTIALIVSPHQLARWKAYAKGRYKIYYDKEERKIAMRKYRAKKRELNIGTKNLKDKGDVSKSNEQHSARYPSE